MNLVSITLASGYVGVSSTTIKRWYKWWGTLNEQDKPLALSLPRIYTQDKRGTWYFDFNDLAQLIEFKKRLPRGAMSSFNAQFWGKYGKEKLRKGEENGQEDVRKVS